MSFPARDGHEHHSGEEAAIRLGHPFRAQPAQLLAQTVRGGYQSGHIHPLTDRSYLSQVACPPFKRLIAPPKLPLRQ